MSDSPGLGFVVTTDLQQLWNYFGLAVAAVKQQEWNVMRRVCSSRELASYILKQLVMGGAMEAMCTNILDVMESLIKLPGVGSRGRCTSLTRDQFAEAFHFLAKNELYKLRRRSLPMQYENQVHMWQTAAARVSLATDRPSDSSLHNSNNSEGERVTRYRSV